MNQLEQTDLAMPELAVFVEIDAQGEASHAATLIMGVFRTHEASSAILKV